MAFPMAKVVRVNVRIESPVVFAFVCWRFWVSNNWRTACRFASCMSNYMCGVQDAFGVEWCTLIEMDYLDGKEKRKTGEKNTHNSILIIYNFHGGRHWCSMVIASTTIPITIISSSLGFIIRGIAAAAIIHQKEFADIVQYFLANVYFRGIGVHEIARNHERDVVLCHGEVERVDDGMRETAHDFFASQWMVIGWRLNEIDFPCLHARMRLIVDETYLHVFRQQRTTNQIRRTFGFGRSFRLDSFAVNLEGTYRTRKEAICGAIVIANDLFLEKG